ncbi:hypothetical protein Ctha_0120 [Chloroherpeton thalassium ATCC 35110]|uniref:Uncharacterized protein n=1 Tax=Chloroherpeton thalassium (strain ATCC 35110 / GB-78) TaxID=517418 RepID=B3QSU8_CHLT3|nr:molecular chaperone TorD family protein [Chloroherpeton thalassium]ACF12591.1 hypothetical protein Ctha_0120 [Chloroherpeton thalassium ATCC 35110]
MKNDTSPQQLETYSKGYHLLAGFFLGPFDRKLLSHAQALPYVMESLRRAYRGAPDEAALLDLAGADHYELFCRQVFPYESFFLSEDARLGGSVSGAVQDFYGRYRFEDELLLQESPDHFGLQLRFLGFLINREATALKARKLREAKAMRHAQRDFLSEHLLHWIYPLVVSVREHGFCFFSFLTEVAFELVLEHWRLLAAHSDKPQAIRHHSGEATEAFEPEAFLEQEETDLKKITGILMRPMQSGVMLSHKTMARVTQASRLPGFFNQRETTFKKLLETAIEYEKLPEVLQSLDACLLQWKQNYEAAPGELKPFTEHWIKRLENSRRVVDAMLKATATQ